MATADEDPAAHIGPAFRAAFPTWGDLQRFVAEHTQPPEFDLRRALTQLIMTDLAHRLTAEPADGWVLRGSLSLPARPGPDPVPRPWRSQDARVDPRYVYARPVFDLDLCATTDDLDLMVALHRVTDTSGQSRPGQGVGLGGLVHYSTAGLRRLSSGRVVGEVTAQPINPHRSRRHLIPVADPYTFQVDLYPRGLAGVVDRPDRSQRSTCAITLPGFDQYRPRLYPTVHQLADKLWIPVGPHTNPPWHRYKDLFDLYYMIGTCRISLAALRQALESNPNRTRTGLETLPVPYQLYQDTAGPTWRDRYQQMRDQHSALAAYPPFEQTIAAIRTFVEGIQRGPADQTWQPAGQWTRPHPQPSPDPRRVAPPPSRSPGRRGPSPGR